MKLRVRTHLSCMKAWVRHTQEIEMGGSKDLDSPGLHEEVRPMGLLNKAYMSSVAP